LLPNPRYVKEYRNRFIFLEPEDERPVRVIHVLKTHKAPRLIAMEPTCMQYTQQALSISLVGKLERDRLLSHFLGFDNQEPNQLMAQKGSSDGSLATLDLSEASDRVVNRHVIEMMKSGRIFSDATQACRSTRADVRGEVITLSKFASMGSAMTFPIEAMFFFCLICIGIESELKRKLTKKDLSALIGKVRVYGDDIIIPVEYVPSVIRTLEGFNLKVNRDKSFWTGKFRESCGKEYYDGSDVSIVKVRKFLPSSRKDTEELVSAVSTRNQFYEAGLWKTARLLDEWIERLIPFPYVERTSPVLGKWSFVVPYQAGRLHGAYQSPLVYGAVVHSKDRPVKTDDIWALVKWFIKEGSEPFFNVNHLEVSGRPIETSIKIRWGSPF